MLYENYLASAFIHKPSASDPRRGAPELVLYNPSAEPCEAGITAYFSDHAASPLPPVHVKAETNALIFFPDYAPDLLADAGFVGFRVLSSTPLMLDLINGVRITVPQPQFRGGCTNFHGTKLDREWHFPDGLWLEWNKQYNGDLSRAPFPFNENEHYHFLNPHPSDVELEMTIRYRRSPHVTRRVTLKSERVWVWDNLDQVEWCQGYSIRALASEPIAAASVRYIYGLTGMEEWGMTIHCAMPGFPGPVPEG